MSTLRRAAARQVVLGVIAVLLLGAAVFVYARSCDLGSDARSDVFIDFTCQACKHAFRMSERDFVRDFEAKKFRQVFEEKRVFFKCPKCGKMEAERSDEEPPAEKK
jgi:rubredoxin